MANYDCIIVSWHVWVYMWVLCRAGQKHICTVYIRYFWQENYRIYGHILCIYTVLASPSLVAWLHRNMVMHGNVWTCLATSAQYWLIFPKVGSCLVFCFITFFHTYTHTYTHIHAGAHTRAHTHTHTHKHTHTHIYTHTSASDLSKCKSQVCSHSFKYMCYATWKWSTGPFLHSVTSLHSVLQNRSLRRCGVFIVL